MSLAVYIRHHPANILNAFRDARRLLWMQRIRGNLRTLTLEICPILQSDTERGNTSMSHSEIDELKQEIVSLRNELHRARQQSDSSYYFSSEAKQDLTRETHLPDTGLPANKR